MLRVINKGASWLWGTFAVLYILILFTKGVLAFVDHDEHQFIAATVLFLREGLLPFRDYTYIHSPYLSMLLMLPFSLSDTLLFGARILSIFSMGLLLLVWMRYMQRGSQSSPLFNVALVLCPMLLISSEAFTYTASRVWEHPSALLFLSLAFIMLLNDEKKGKVFWALQGFFSAFACLIRIGYAPLGVLIFLLVVLRLKTEKNFLLSWFTGVVIAFLPLLLLGLLAPSGLYFGLWTFHTEIDPAYLAQSASHTKFDQGILSMIALGMSKDLLPLYLFSLAMLVLFLWKGIASKKWDRKEVISLLFFTAAVWVSIAKGVVFLQYLTLPLLFLWIFGIQVFLKLQNNLKQRSAVFLLICSLGAIALNHSIYWRMHLLFQPQKWTALNIHHQSVTLMENTDKNCTVMSLSPLFVLEAKRKIFPELANGPFLWRTADFVTPEQSEKYPFIGEKNLEAFMREKQPCAILLGHEERLEKKLLNYSLKSFTQTESAMGLKLFQRNDSAAHPFQ